MKKSAINIFLVPGLGNSGEGHWQTMWEDQLLFKRINQIDWDTPTCSDWVDGIAEALRGEDPSAVILVGHSLACATIAHWARQYPLKIKGALLVAPSDIEADTYPEGTTGFAPMPTERLPFPSIVVASSNDPYVRVERAAQFAGNWGSELIVVEKAGHINANSGLGIWAEGLRLLQTFINAPNEI